MTIPWQPSADEWRGATVAVFGSGPSLTAEAAEALRHHFVIAVNEAARLAPWADMLVALDAGWPQHWREFAGMRVTGVEDAELDALYVGHRFHRVPVAGGQIEIRNSGLEAVRIAAEMGASRIILLGFDHPLVRGHFYDDEVDTGEYVGLAEGMAHLIAELAARGVIVARYEPPPVDAPAKAKKGK